MLSYFVHYFPHNYQQQNQTRPRIGFSSPITNIVNPMLSVIPVASPASSGVLALERS